jgi:hypothetical protein
LKAFQFIITTAVFFCFAFTAKAQKVEDIFFHLYTDSLKKGVHNYINVDGKLTDGTWRPLTSKEIEFAANTGNWDGNSLIIDSSYNKDSVVVTAVLKDKPEVSKKVTIYMKKNSTNGTLKTEDELFRDWNNKKKRKNIRS